MVINGDVKGFGSGAGIAMGTVAGGADTWLVKASKLLDIKVKELAWGGAFITDDRRFRRVERGEAVKTVALEDAGESGFGDGEDHEHLGVRTALAAEGEDLGFEFGGSLARLVMRSGGTILEAMGETRGLGALEPFADGFFGDAEGSGRSP